MSTDRHPLPLHARFLLLAHDPPTGRGLVDDTRLKVGLSGAALLELAQLGVIRLEGEGRHTRVRATGVTPPAELAEVLERAVDRSPKDAIGRFGGASSFTDRAGRLRTDTWQRLEVAGYVRPVTDKVLGLFPRTRWHHVTGEHVATVDAVRSALDGNRSGDPAVAVLVSIAQATGLLRKLFPQVPAKDLRARAEVASASVWGGPAVAKAIADINAAVVAATTAATTAAVVGGSG
ncbi:GPP34 family phosphoprotein [Oryzobacter telluris]|uniref:GOLPH3/VPS74 family protein n=1 Tax=Oryzobacter telluris TaxID=3149179 RepID=UPI00370DC305